MDNHFSKNLIELDGQTVFLYTHLCMYIKSCQKYYHWNHLIARIDESILFSKNRSKSEQTRLEPIVICLVNISIFLFFLFSFSYAITILVGSHLGKRYMGSHAASWVSDGHQILEFGYLVYDLYSNGLRYFKQCVNF